MTKIPSDDEILDLARHAGLDLPEACRAELIEAYGHVHRMMDRISAARPHGDEPAHVFDPSTFRTARE